MVFPVALYISVGVLDVQHLTSLFVEVLDGPACFATPIPKLGFAWLLAASTSTSLVRCVAFCSITCHVHLLADPALRLTYVLGLGWV